MPTKYKVSEKIRDRQTGKVKTVHYYIKSATDIQLLHIVQDEKTKPKVKQKCLNELVRRRTQ
jgi:hypothetical protein|tara:strand:+ start:1684 stop:1869 length:186 start_codon:yes stop_codon:yes gene_type:complete